MNSNKTPFTDICLLVAVKAQKNSNGYDDLTESKTEAFCSVSKGVARSEFYEAFKAGVQLNIAVELWEDDYNDAELLEYGGKRYKIIRTYPTGHGTLELTCSEVVR